MIEECRKVVELKRKVDNKIQELVDKKVVSCRGNLVATQPHNFLLKVLPFWHGDIYKRIEDSTVDSRQILSGTYREYGGIDITKEYLDGINNASRTGYDKPSYHKVGELPLYVAWEGKNRVSIFSAHNSDIACKVKLTSYPAPSSLRIHEVCFRKGVYFVSCKDPAFITTSEIVQVVHPEIIIPLLRAYGVLDGKKVLKLFTLPMEKRVFRKLTTCLMSN